MAASDRWHIGTQRYPATERPGRIWQALWLAVGACLSAGAQDYVLSFQEQDASESGAAEGGAPFLSVIVNGNSIYRKGMAGTGPLWHETARFSVPDPRAVSISFRLEGGGVPVHLGNIRIATERGGEVRLDGKWTAGKSRPEYITRLWDGGDIPYRMGLTLRPPAGVTVAPQDWCEYTFNGSLSEAPNLAATRVFEYMGCFDDLNYYDDYKNISFEPARPAPSQDVTVSAKVRNSGSGPAIGAVVALLVDGREVGRKTADIPAAAYRSRSSISASRTASNADSIPTGLQMWRQAARSSRRPCASPPSAPRRKGRGIFPSVSRTAPCRSRSRAEGRSLSCDDLVGEPPWR